ncbi:MAG: caspase family protein [Clostridia bacterium]|nr:caspase family protein [Clostridia bacterium]
MVGARATRLPLAICLTACLAFLPAITDGCAAAAPESAHPWPDNARRAERALLIGIDDFVSKPSAYPSSTNNVYAMQEAFQAALEPLVSLLIPDESITDAQTLIRLIQETFADAEEGDVSYLYISTHGSYVPGSGQEPALLLSDGVTEGCITAAELEAAFEPIEGTKVLWLDACNSGAFLGKGQADQPAAIHFLGNDFKVLTSSGALEESWYWSEADMDAPEAEPNHKEGRFRPQGAFYFTHALSQSMSPRYGYPADINRDGRITLTELYDYLLLNHAASTPQVYPQRDDFVVFRYDVNAPLPEGLQRSPILDVTFSDAMLDGVERRITMEYIATRPVRVAYQIVCQRDGKWLFDEARLLYDNMERFTAFGDQEGAVSAGRKVRTLSINVEEDAYGYVMVHLVSIDQGRLTVHAGRVLCVPPAEGNLNLAVDAPDEYELGNPREICILVKHAFPCALSVSIVNDRDEVVHRLCHRRGTRPGQIYPSGSYFYWDGSDRERNPLPAGVYRVRVAGVMNEHTFTVISGPIEIRNNQKGGESGA